MATADGTQAFRGRSVAHETSYDGDGTAALSETIIDAVATAHDVDPTDCDLELYETVDLEALDALFDRRAPDGHWQFEFSIEGYLVVVTGDGHVTVWENR